MTENKVLVAGGQEDQGVVLKLLTDLESFYALLTGGVREVRFERVGAR